MAERNIIYREGIGYVKANLEQVDQSRLERVGEEGTNPFFVLPVKNDGILDKIASRVFRNLPQDIKDVAHEVVYGKTEILRRYQKILSEKRRVQ